MRKLILGISLIGVFWGIVLFLSFKDHAQNIGQKEFANLLQEAKEFQSDSNYLYFQVNDQTYKIFKTPSLLEKIEVPISQKSQWLTYTLFIFVLTTSALLLFLVRHKFFSASLPSPQSSNNIQSKTSKDIITPSFTSSSVTLDSLAGISEVKEDLKEILDYLKNPNKYKKLGLRMPKGILLVGPPGVGKTMLAKAMANEAGIPFFYHSGSSFSQIFVGSGAKKVQELFAQAKEAQSAIIFIDEIDSVGKERGSGRNDERESTLNQLLTEMDGFAQSSNLIIFGATNHPDVLDPALLRSGRFDRKIYIDLPSPKEREEIFSLYLKNKRYNFSISQFSHECLGFSGAMIESLVNEAGLLMLRENREILEERDMQRAKNKLTLSLKKSLTLTQEQKQILSLYQASKALFALKSHIVFLKISLREEESIWEIQEMQSQEQALSTLKLYLIGYIALKTHYKQSYTCVEHDLKSAKEWSEKILLEYGMGRELFEYDKNLLLQAQKECKDFLIEHTKELKLIQDELFKKESLTTAEIYALL